MRSFASLTMLALFIAAPVQAQEMGWVVKPATADHGVTLSLAIKDANAYRFECTATDVIVTETGVAKLMDLKTGKPIGDDADAVMPQGAAMMAVFGGKGDPKFVPGEAVKNSAIGWDISIHLAKNDKQLKAVPKSEMMSLFTTGWTTAVQMDEQARTAWNGFLRLCNG